MTTVNTQDALQVHRTVTLSDNEILFTFKKEVIDCNRVANVLRAQLVPSAGGLSVVSDKQFQLVCEPLPTRHAALTGGPAYNLLSVLADGEPIITATSCLHLHSHPYASRFNFQHQTALVKPIECYKWLPVIGTEQELALHCWREYQNFLKHTYNTKFYLPVLSLPASMENSVQLLLSEFVMPTVFDLGVRAKNKLSIIAATTFGASFAKQMRDAMQYPDFLPYLAYTAYEAATKQQLNKQTETLNTTANGCAIFTI